MPGDLRIGGPIVGDRRRDRLGLAKAVDLYDPGCDRAPRRLPDETAGKAAAECERGEKAEPPVFGLNSR
jgi:hypothetical protein